MTDAARQQTWSEIVSVARTANLVAFADKGIAVLDQQLAGATSENSLSWDELLSKAARAEILKFSAGSIMVLVWQI